MNKDVDHSIVPIVRMALNNEAFRDTVITGQEAQVVLMTLQPGQVAYDLVYDPAPTPFLAAARQRGAASHHGLGMLIGQAAVSYERWTQITAPREVMAAAARRALLARQAPQRP